MGNKSYIIKLLLLCVCIFTVFQVGCSANQNDQPSTIFASQSFTKSLAITHTKGFDTPTPSYSPVPTYTATSTFVPTTIPTPPGDISQDKLIYLDETNGGCALPCLWGIEPGKTRWIDADPFLRSFVGSLSREPRDPDYSGRIYRADYSNYMDPNQPLYTLFYVSPMVPKKVRSKL